MTISMLYTLDVYTPYRGCRTTSVYVNCFKLDGELIDDALEHGRRCYIHNYSFEREDTTPIKYKLVKHDRQSVVEEL